MRAQMKGTWMNSGRSWMKRTWAEVSMERLEHNYHALRNLTPYGTKFLGLV